MNITNYTEPTSDSIYENFNSFIFSKDIKVLGKLLFRNHFYNMTKHLPGDIVEIGVFKGSGIVSWLKILKVFDSQTNKKVIGFDFFSPNDTKVYINRVANGEGLNDVINRVEHNLLSYETVNNTIQGSGFDNSKFILVKGNVETTTKDFVNKNAGFRISLLYFDADLGEPTYHSLVNLWDRIIPGGYIVFDEYEFHAFDECLGVEKFLKEKGLEYTIETTHFYNPTAFMIKKKF